MTYGGNTRMRTRVRRRRALAGGVAAVALALTASSASAATYSVLGQPNLASTTLASRCENPNARFNYLNEGFERFGPAGIAVAPDGRLFVTDFGGKRVLVWPNANALSACQPASAVIGAGSLEGPEAVAVDNDGFVYVADTLSHVVRIYRQNTVGGPYALHATLGTPGTPGPGMARMNFPRGLAVTGSSGPGGRLFVADDYNDRVLIFNAPFTDGEAAADSIGAGNNGGFSHPKAVAFAGGKLFVADYDKNRVLRFPGPFNDPATTYTANATFTGLNHPVDLAVGPDATLYVTDQGNQRVASYAVATEGGNRTAPTSAFSDHLGPEPLGVAVAPGGRVLVADYRRFRVLIRDPDSLPPGTDTTPPRLTLSAPARAKLGRSIRVDVGCNETCLASAKGKITVKTRRGGPRSFKLGDGAAYLPSAGRSSVDLSVPARARRAAKKALRRGGKATASIRIAAIDAAANQSTATRKISVR